MIKTEIGFLSVPSSRPFTHGQVGPASLCYTTYYTLAKVEPVAMSICSVPIVNISFILIRKAFDIHFVTNESDNKLILFERRFDVSKRRSNKINLLSL